MPKWMKQVIASLVLLAVTMTMLYVAGKQAGTFDLLYNFIILTIASAYVIMVFLVSYDAEIRGASVFWVSFLCVFLGPVGAAVWLAVRPDEFVSFHEIEEEAEPDES